MSPEPNNDDDEVRRAAEILLEMFNCRRCPSHTVCVEDSDGKKKEETCIVVILSAPRFEDESSPPFPSAPSCSLSKLPDKEHVTRVDDQPQSQCCSPPLPFHPFNEGVVDRTPKDKGKGKGKGKDKSKVHQCKYAHCGKIFPSGQALGGHMREHYTGPPIKMKRKVVSNNGLQPEVKLEVVTNIDINMPLTYYEVGEASNSKQEEKVENHKQDELEVGEIRDSHVENHKEDELEEGEEDELEEGEIRDSPLSKHE